MLGGRFEFLWAFVIIDEQTQTARAQVKQASLSNTLNDDENIWVSLCSRKKRQGGR